MATVTPGMAIVFGLIGVALLLFVSEALPSDVTAIAILVALAVLEPWTGVSAATAISGFASSATITILAMYILSEGVQRTGVVDRLGLLLARVTKGDERRLVGATVTTTGIAAGIVNNTPVVAVFIPMITGLAEKAGVSPSKLLLPLSYAAMLGGTLTLIATSTNLLASDLSRQLLDHPIGMFEFTPLGILVLVVGIAYLLTVGRWLTPARIAPNVDFTEEYDLESHLSLVRVREDSPLVGMTLSEAQARLDESDGGTVDLLWLDRDEQAYEARYSDIVIEADDELAVRLSLQTLNQLADPLGLRQLPREQVVEEDLLTEAGTVVEAVVLPNSGLVGDRIDETHLKDALHTTVLAIRRGPNTIRHGLAEQVLESGDTLLLQTTEAAIDYLAEEGDLLVTERAQEDLLDPTVDEDEVAPLSPTTPYALGILGGVIVLAALGWVPIVIAALGGVVAMVVTGCLTASDAYDAVSWNVIFLLAGILPLGVAMQTTGGDALIASFLVEAGGVLPVLAMLALFYLLTAVLASAITPVATVVLMIPIAVDTATRIGADGFAFLLAVTFASSGAFMTPIGYQTNLMVYGPGGYRFTDYFRVGAPLQLLLTVTVTLGIAVLFGV
ncbi:MAG: SLC13 family permease [Halobacteriales archaeon]|nr:SLC13 family permease [Halobacteriales archaeon]